MANFKIASNKIAGREAGSVVRDTDLVGVNIAALVEAGHLLPVSGREAKQDKTETEQE